MLGNTIILNIVLGGWGFTGRGGFWRRARYPRNCTSGRVRRRDGLGESQQLADHASPYNMSVWRKRVLEGNVTYTVKQSYIKASAAGVMFMETSSGIGGA